jgi:6-phosphogluconolactonase
MRRIHISATADDLSLDAAHEFVRVTADAVKVRGRCFVALAGGSTPRGLYRALANTQPIRAQVPWSRIEFFWSDERHVPPDDPESNYRMASEAMLAAAPVTPTQIHRVRAENPDAVIVGRQYEEEILTDVAHDGGMPRFDLMLLGLGTDGHTASLFPGTTALAERQRLCVDTWVERLKTHRITMTLPIINAARAVMFVVSGADKASIARDVLQPDSTAADRPAQLVQPHGELLWMLDHEAARMLAPSERERAEGLDRPVS